MLLLVALLSMVGFLAACGGPDASPAEEELGELQGTSAQAARTRPLTGIYSALRQGALPLLWENGSGRVLAGFYDVNQGSLRLSKVLLGSLARNDLALVVAIGGAPIAAASTQEVRLSIGDRFEIRDRSGVLCGSLELGSPEAAAGILEVSMDSSFSGEPAPFEGNDG